MGDPRAGYLLVEVVAAMAVTIMLITFAFPSVPNGTTPSRLLGLITASVSLLREARTEALAQGKPTAATFDSVSRTLRAGSQIVGIPPDVDFSLVAGGNCPADDTRAQILFRADGTNCGGVLRFAKGRRILRARINWVDGRIDVVEGE